MRVLQEGDDAMNLVVITAPTPKYLAFSLSFQAPSTNLCRGFNSHSKILPGFWRFSFKLVIGNY